MFLAEKEKEAVRSVVQAGRVWGFGNLIDRLRIAWVMALKESDPSLSWKTACAGAGLNSERASRIIKGAEKDEQALIGELKRYIGDI